MTRKGFTRTHHLYTLHVAAHRVEPRYDIPDQEIKLYALTKRWAVIHTVHQVARAAGIPNWKPWLREIATHTTVRSVEQVEIKIT